ncbi:MAG: hypothetical protein ACRDT4_27245 [Micromonosporaceae bacterium]
MTTMTEHANDPGQPPGAAGIPDIADDEGPRRPEDEDPQRFSVPGDAPVGLDEYGTGREEARHGEPLSRKVNREEPDVLEPPGRQAESPEGDLSAEEIAVNEEPSA